MDSQFKYTDQELELIKQTFAEDDALLIILRKVLMQGELNAVELARLPVLQSKDVVKLLRKIILPAYDLEAPIGQTTDIWSGLNLPVQVKVQMTPHIKAMKKLVDYLNDRFSVLEGNEAKETDKLSDLLDGTFEGISARQRIIEVVEKGLLFLKVIAGSKAETSDEQKKRLMQNSNK
jgi:hypothetical protein